MSLSHSLAFGCAALAAAAGPVNINKADAAKLASELQGVGPALAEAIVADRQARASLLEAEGFRENRRSFVGRFVGAAHDRKSAVERNGRKIECARQACHGEQRQTDEDERKQPGVHRNFLSNRACMHFLYRWNRQ